MALYPDVRPLPRRAPQLDPPPRSTLDASGKGVADTLAPSSLQPVRPGSPVPRAPQLLPARARWPRA